MSIESRLDAPGGVTGYAVELDDSTGVWHLLDRGIHATQAGATAHAERTYERLPMRYPRGTLRVSKVTITRNETK